MYVELKKAVVIFIFLFSIILMLFIQNYNLKKDSYNVLVISNENDLTKESLSRTVWLDVQELASKQTQINSQKLNYKYLEVNNNDNLGAFIDENIKNEDFVIIVGDLYNNSIKEVFQEYEDVKFILIENSLSFEEENVYKININVGEIYSTITKYFKDELKRLKKEKKLGENDKLDVLFFDNDNGMNYNDIQNDLEQIGVNLQFVDPKDYPSEEFLKWYETQKEVYMINLSLTNQEGLIKKTLQIQKDNIYDYYEGLDVKEPVEFKPGDDSNELKYIPIHYIGAYSGDDDLGSYDNILETPVVENNILVFDFELDYTKYLENIIYKNDEKNNYKLNMKDKTLKFDII